MSSPPTPSAASFPPSDTDGQTLYRYGLDIAEGTVGIIWETIFLSAYGVFFAVALYSIFRRGRGLKSRSSIIMLVVVVYFYATSVTLWALDVTDVFQSIHALLMDFPTMPLADRVFQADIKLLHLGTPSAALFMFNMLVGDAVVIWRAWVLNHRALWAVTVPCFLLLMSFVFTIIDILCITGTVGFSRSATNPKAGVCPNAQMISWALSLGTNASCTVLIGIRAWQHRKAVRSLNINGRRISTEKILALLVECGFIYCLFWLTQVIIFLPIPGTSPAFYVKEMFSEMGHQISGMYPTLIIVIVNLRYTIWDSEGTVVDSRRLGPGSTDVSTLRCAWPAHRGVPVSLDNTTSQGGDESGTPMEDVSKRFGGAVEDV